MQQNTLEVVVCIYLYICVKLQQKSIVSICQIFGLVVADYLAPGGIEYFEFRMRNSIFIVLDFIGDCIHP
jgi:hypothetical protein